MLFLLLATISCSKENLSSNSDSAYFPLSIGQSTKFDIERTIYSLSSSPETDHLLTLQVISDSFKDIHEQQVFKTMYYVQENKSEWKLDSTGTSWHTLDKALSQENGRTIVNMCFPLTEKVMWNGNLFNSNGETMFRAVDVGEPFQIGNTIYPNTVTIIRQDDSTLLSKNKYIEIYAKDVGLIRKEKVFLQYCNPSDCVGNGVINTGWKELSTIKND